MRIPPAVKKVQKQKLLKGLKEGFLYSFGFALSRYQWLSLLLLLITGFGLMVQMASGNTILQTIVDDDKRGRVMSFYVMCVMGTTPIGSLLAGAVADRLGTPETLLIGGVAAWQPPCFLCENCRQ